MIWCPGFHVIATVRKTELLDVLRKEGFSPVKLDITSEASIADCRAEVEKLVNGRLNILINNAYVFLRLQHPPGSRISLFTSLPPVSLLKRNPPKS